MPGNIGDVLPTPLLRVVPVSGIPPVYDGWHIQITGNVRVEGFCRPLAVGCWEMRLTGRGGLAAGHDGIWYWVEW